MEYGHQASQYNEVVAKQAAYQQQVAGQTVGGGIGSYPNAATPRVSASEEIINRIAAKASNIQILKNRLEHLTARLCGPKSEGETARPSPPPPSHILSKFAVIEDAFANIEYELRECVERLEAVI